MNSPTELPDLPGPADWSVAAPERAFEVYFEPLRELLDRDWLGYRNHCLRVFINVQALAPADLDLAPVIPAVVFHDIAMWTHRTVDYLEPSAELACEHLTAIDRSAWIEPVRAMILWHHKQRAYTGPHAEYADPLRRADMGDFTFGLQGGVPRTALREGRSRYPNAGFHALLMRRTLGRLLTKPWSPLPMMRW